MTCEHTYAGWKRKRIVKFGEFLTRWILATIDSPSARTIVFG